MLKAVYIGLLIFLLPFYFFADTNADKGIIMFLLVIVFGSTLFFFLKKERKPLLKGQFLKHTTLAIIGTLIVFFQTPLDYLLGNVSLSKTYLWIDSRVIIKSLVLSTLALLAFILGCLFYKKREKRSKKTNNIQNERPLKINFLILLAAGALGVYFMVVDPVYFFGNIYGVYKMPQSAIIAIGAFEYLIFAAAIQKWRNLYLTKNIPKGFVDYLKKLGKPIIILIGIYILTVLLSGDRTPLIIYGTLIAGGYFFLTKKKLPFRYVLLFLFVGAVGITALGFARSVKYRNMSFVERVEASMDESYEKRFGYTSIIPQTQELAMSYRILNLAIANVPDNYDFFYGRFLFQRFAVIIPSFSTFYPLIFDDIENKYRTEASFFTWLTYGKHATAGVGSSSIASLYIDFGFIGVLFGFFFFGYLMRLSEVAMYDRNIPPLFINILFIVFLCNVIYIARGSIYANFLPVFWIYIVLWANKKIFNKKLGKS